MAKTDHACRIYLVGNPDKPDSVRAFEDLRSLASPGCQLVGASLSREARAAVEANADRVIVVGGDGTLIGIARSLGADQIPLVGVNVGKLGFLAEFSVDELKSSLDRVLHEDALVSRRSLLQVTVHRNGGGTDVSLAINDCVIQAGPPFRVINLAVAIDGEHLTNVAGDGLIVCTPSGSTAHNLPAGGPILQPEIDAIVLTPLSPHSLTHKPLVVERESTIEIRAAAVNDGTTVIVDGQASYPLGPGDRVSVQRFSTDFLIVRNPLYAKWHNLVTKLHWGKSPSYE